MLGGRLAAEAAEIAFATGDRGALRARPQALHEGTRARVLGSGIMQYFWYRNDKRRERFVTMCRDPDVQRLTWEAYMNKRMVKGDPLAHIRIFFKDLAHLLRLVSP